LLAYTIKLTLEVTYNRGRFWNSACIQWS